MKNQIPIIAILILILFQSCLEQKRNEKEYTFKEKVSIIDTSFVQQASIENICPCKTTIVELRKLGQLKEVEIENMELGKDCIGIDTRFENGKGYKLDNKGIIIQKDDGTEYVVKIHLSKDFEGKLPNGKYISLKNLKLKDVISMFPNFDYESSACSKYWNYNNDTLYFYFDKSIKEYQSEEKFNVDKSIEGVDIVLWCSKIYSSEYIDEIHYGRPLYAPLKETHINVWVDKPINDWSNGVLSSGNGFTMIKLGKWKEYSPEHKLIVNEIYDNKGNLIEKIK